MFKDRFFIRTILKYVIVLHYIILKIELVIYSSIEYIIYSY